MSEKHFQVGVKGLSIEDNKLLLLTGYYDETKEPVMDLPGGRIHKDDTTIEQTLRRELEEELPGIANIALGKLIAATHMPKDFPDGSGWLLLYYIVQASLPNPIQLTHEHTAYEWVSSQELDGLYADQNRQADFHKEMFEICKQALK